MVDRLYSALAVECGCVEGDLAKEQKAHVNDLAAARSVQEAATQALQVEKVAHQDAAAAWSRQQQEMQVELATLRERAAGVEHRATDLASQLQRLHEQSEREIAQLRESQAATAALLRQLEARRGKGDGKVGEKPHAGRVARGDLPSI